MLDQLSPTAVLLVVLVLTTGCKLSCLAPKAEQIDSPIAEHLNTAARSGGTTANKDGARPPDFDHATWGELLAKHSKYDEGRVDYAGFARDDKQLRAYTDTLATVALDKLSQSQQKALLINAYNAFTVQLMLAHYPGIESIKNLEDPWKQKRWKLAGDTVSLDDIEHGLLRPTYKDPRIHFAVNCASIGCPPLADFAFRGSKLDEQLDRVTTAAMRNPRYAKAIDGTLRLTKIMSWYGDDFTGEGWDPRADSLPEFAARYATADVKALVESKGPQTPVEFLDYDWSINDVRP